MGYSVSAQFSESTERAYEVYNENYVHQTQRAGGPNSLASVDTIWFNDFSDTTDWSYAGSIDEWSLDTLLSPSLISQGFDDVINSASGGYFAIIDSDGSGSTGVQDAILEFTGGTIDCSASPKVQLVFQTYLRQYEENRQVLVSNDGGVVWDTIPVLTQFGINTTSSNPYIEMVDISATAGGQSNVQIKFRYEGSWDWFWVIDDAMIISIPDNELALTQEFYNGTADLTYTNYYSMMPLKQADSAQILFGASVQNNGGADQTQAFVNVMASFNGVLMFSDTTDSVTAVSYTHLRAHET